MKTNGVLETQCYDMIVIGGGPAGSTVATLVAEKGPRVLLLERDPEPRFKIGESLIPASYWTFERLGMLEKLKSSHFPKKHSVQFYSQSGKASAPFYFYENAPHESSITWQVLRSEFDEMLLENAREKGVEVRRGVGVHSVLFEKDRAVGVRTKSPNGDSTDLSARVIADSTGQSALISRRLKINDTEPQLKKASIYTHFQGGIRDEGINEGATLILHTETKDSWFWYIPLPYDRVSVGVVGSIKYLLQDRRSNGAQLDAEAIFQAETGEMSRLEMANRKRKATVPGQNNKGFFLSCSANCRKWMGACGGCFRLLGSGLFYRAVFGAEVWRDGGGRNQWSV